MTRLVLATANRATFADIAAASAALVEFSQSAEAPAVYEVELYDLNKARAYGAGEAGGAQWAVKIKDDAGFSLGWVG